MKIKEIARATWRRRRGVVEWGVRAARGPVYVYVTDVSRKKAEEKARAALGVSEAVWKRAILSWKKREAKRREQEEARRARRKKSPRRHSFRGVLLSRKKDGRVLNATLYPANQRSNDQDKGLGAVRRALSALFRKAGWEAVKLSNPYRHRRVRVAAKSRLRARPR